MCGFIKNKNHKINNMTKFYLLFLAFSFVGQQAMSQTTWDNFEDQRKGTYGFISGSFIPYNENPDQTGANTSQVAASYTRNPAEQFDVIILEGAMDDLSDYVSGEKVMSIDVWSPAAGTTIQITTESSETALPANFPTGRHSVYLTETTVSESWETLTFSFDNQPDPSVADDNVDRIVLLFDPETNNDDTYFWDNLNGPELADDPCENVITDEDILNDYECNQNVNYIFSHAGVNFRRILNPFPDGNPSPYVSTYTRNSGEEFDVIIGRFDGNLSVSDNSSIFLDVRDPAAPTEVIVSLQADNGDVILEMTATTSVSNEWETLEYDPSPVSASTDIAQFVILFDPENFSSDTYLFDNFMGTDITAVEDVELLTELKTFPNPATSNATIEYELLDASNVRLTVSDITGRLVHSEVLTNNSLGKNQVQLNTGSYSDGVYIYTLHFKGGNASGKLIVQN
jgi:hypothetical protein